MGKNWEPTSTLASSILKYLLPYTLIWDSKGILIYVAERLRNWWKIDSDTPLSQVKMEMHRPIQIPLEPRHLDSLTDMNLVISRTGTKYYHNNQALKLRGQLHSIDELWLYAGFPDVTSTVTLSDFGLRLSDLPSQYVVGDMVIALEISQTAYQEASRKSKELEKKNNELRDLVRDLKSSKKSQHISDIRYRALFDNAHDLIQVVDKEGNLSFVNPAWTNAMGYTLKEVRGQSVFEFLSPESRSHCQEIFNNLMMGFRQTEVSVTFICKDGRFLETEGNINPQYHDGEVVATQGIFRDITARKRADAERERLLSAIESLDDSVVLFDKEDRISFCNKAYKTLYKNDPDLIKLGTLFEDHLRTSVHKGLMPESFGIEGKWIEQQLQRHSNPSDSFEVKGADSKVMLVKEQKLRDGDIIRIISDITTQKNTQVELIQAGKMATLGEMATGVAHELNQPLSVIDMAVENTIECIDEGVLDHGYLSGKLMRISSQVKRASKIINHMRIFGRKSEKVSSEVDMRKVVEDAFSLFGEQLSLIGIIVEKDFPVVCRKVQGQADQFEQVVINLLSNARDAIKSNRQRPEDPGRISVKVEDRGLENKIKVIVTDNGGGIPESIIKNVFDPFFTTKDPGVGTGLGLSISYSIIRDWGGTIKVENKGNSTCITIIFPVKA